MEIGIMILEHEIQNTEINLKYNKPHKNSNQYKAYMWRIEQLNKAIEYLKDYKD